MKVIVVSGCAGSCEWVRSGTSGCIRSLCKAKLTSEPPRLLQSLRKCLVLANVGIAHTPASIFHRLFKVGGFDLSHFITFIFFHGFWVLSTPPLPLNVLRERIKRQQKIKQPSNLFLTKYLGYYVYLLNIFPDGIFTSTLANLGNICTTETLGILSKGPKTFHPSLSKVDSELYRQHPPHRQRCYLSVNNKEINLEYEYPLRADTGRFSGLFTTFLLASECRPDSARNGAFFSASSKAFLRLLSLSPASFDIISGPLMQKKKAPVSFATALAIKVLPEPGGSPSQYISVSGATTQYSETTVLRQSANYMGPNSITSEELQLLHGLRLVLTDLKKKPPPGSPSDLSRKSRIQQKRNLRNDEYNLWLQEKKRKESGYK
ncbi:hypothetical protein M5K25_009524 [Dendrobium thyrsiflorum]|uniref:Uncharacterized protein n=1 Tax=Dendrobium thyrsiflorum TaxID=117978 RepID=A0ABD0V6H8_DENTH